MFGIWEKVKLAAIAVVAFLGLFFGWNYTRRGRKIEAQEEELKAKDQQMEAAEVIHESEVKQKDLEIDLKEEEVKVEKKVQKTKDSNKDKVYSTPDEEEYEVKLP